MSNNPHGFWYLRFYYTHKSWVKDSPKAHYVEVILTAHDLIKNTKGQARMDAVELDTGKVARNDYKKKPLPKWLECPLSRALAAAQRKAP